MSAFLYWLGGTVLVTAAALLLGWIIACLILRSFYGVWVWPDGWRRKR